MKNRHLEFGVFIDIWSMGSRKPVFPSVSTVHAVKINWSKICVILVRMSGHRTQQIPRHFRQLSTRFFGRLLQYAGNKFFSYLFTSDSISMSNMTVFPASCDGKQRTFLSVNWRAFILFLIRQFTVDVLTVRNWTLVSKIRIPSWLWNTKSWCISQAFVRISLN